MQLIGSLNKNCLVFYVTIFVSTFEQKPWDPEQIYDKEGLSHAFI